MNATSATTRRRVGRPRAFDREQALEHALDLFWRQGFEGVSTAQLCDAMGINPPSMYAAFGSKETLYLSCLALYVERHGRLLREALQDSVPAREAVERILLGAARQYTDPSHAPGCMVSCGGLQTGAEHHNIQDALAQQRHSAQQAIAARLTQARLDGELPPGTDAQALAGYFAMVIQGMAIQARDGAKASALRQMARLALLAWPAA